MEFRLLPLVAATLVSCAAAERSSLNEARYSSGAHAANELSALAANDRRQLIEANPAQASNDLSHAERESIRHPVNASSANLENQSAKTPPVVASDASPTDAAGAAPPEGSTVLHVGDSFAGALGLDLNRELKKLGVRGILKYKTATYIPTWAWGKELGRYIADYKPDLVLITLGANELNIQDPSLRIRAIEKLVSTVGARPCVWIAPPLWQGARPDLLRVIRAHAAPCSYMDSSSLVPDLPRGKDHIHPTVPARAEWAKLTLEWLLQQRAPRPGLPWALRETQESRSLIP